MRSWFSTSRCSIASLPASIVWLHSKNNGSSWMKLRGGKRGWRCRRNRRILTLSMRCRRVKIPGKNQKSSLSEIMKGSSNWLSPEKVIVNIPGFSKEEVNSDIFLNKFSSQIDKAILMDPLSGPQLEAKRRSLGLSYERKLETLLNRLGNFWRNLLLVSCNSAYWHLC